VGGRIRVGSPVGQQPVVEVEVEAAAFVHDLRAEVAKLRSELGALAQWSNNR